MDMFGLIALAIIVVLFVRMKRINTRLDHIERYLEQTTKELQAPASTAVELPATPASTEQALVHARAQSEPAAPERDTWRAQPHELGTMERFVHWCKEDWLMKLGGLLVILGAGWFVSYAIAQGWIGEVGRIALGLAAGAAVMALGWYRIHRYVAQGGILMFVGAVTIVITMFAARELYDFFTPLSALAIIFLTSAVLGATSVVFKRRSLAYANVLLAAIAPMLVNAADFSVAGLLTYLLVLTVGTVWVTVVTGWRLLPLLSLIVVGLYSLGIIGDSWRYSADLDIGLLFSYAFTALYFAVSVFAMRKMRVTNTVDLLTALGAGLFLHMWILVAGESGGNDWRSILLVAWTMVFAWGSFLAVRWGAAITYFYAYAAVGVAYLASATMLELEGPALTTALLFEAAALLWVGYRVTRQASAVPVLALPMAVPLLMSLESVGAREWRDSIVHEHALVLVLVSAVCAWLAYRFARERSLRPEPEGEALETMAHIGYILMGLYDAALVWLVAHALFTYETGTLLALIVYTLIAAAFYVRGKQTGKKWQRTVAGTLFIAVIARLLLVDVWNMPLEMRFVTFLVLGVLIIAIAWIERSAIGARMHNETNLS